MTRDQVEAMTIANRIAVIKDGYLQAYCPPDELYDQPRTMFIAGFVGNPPMNFIDMEVIRENGSYHARRDDLIDVRIGEANVHVLADPVLRLQMGQNVASTLIRTRCSSLTQRRKSLCFGIDQSEQSDVYWFAYPAGGKNEQRFTWPDRSPRGRDRHTRVSGGWTIPKYKGADCSTFGLCALSNFSSGIMIR